MQISAFSKRSHFRLSLGAACVAAALAAGVPVLAVGQTAPAP